MADEETVSHLQNSHNSLSPRLGVVTLFGYGTSVRVERGHLVLEDGIGSDRHHARFPRVCHGLKRLVAIGSDGLVSFAALRWLADQNASFVMLERDAPFSQPQVLSDLPMLDYGGHKPWRAATALQFNLQLN